MPWSTATLACCLCLAVAASAQRVVLPGGTGGLTPGVAWTVLRAADLERATRAGDPTDATAQALLLGVIADLRERTRLADHVLLHSLGGASDQLRLVNAYSADLRVGVDELLTDRAVGEIRRNLEQTLGPQVVEFAGHDRTDVFAIGGLCLHFALRHGEVRRPMDLYVVPAGPRLQYFEVTTSADDAAAATDVAALLRTFDGAREEPDHTLRNMLIGGAAGGLCGILAALLRRRRHQRLAAMAGSAAAGR